MNNKQLSEYLNKWYWKHNQILTVDTFEDRTYDPQNYHWGDVCLYNPKTAQSIKYLFTINNYWCFSDIEQNLKGEFFHPWDSIRASCTPYYMNREFFIPKWTPITDNDIYRCTKYFIEKVLGLKYRIWNIRVNEQTPVIGFSGYSGKMEQ